MLTHILRVLTHTLKSPSSYHHTSHHTPTYSHTHTPTHTLSIVLFLARALSHTNTHIQNVRAKNSPPCCADESRCVNMAALEACTISSSESNTAYAAACLIAIAFDPPVCDVTHFEASPNPILCIRVWIQCLSCVVWPLAFGTLMCVTWMASERGMTRFMRDICLGWLAKSDSRVCVCVNRVFQSDWRLSMWLASLTNFACSTLVCDVTRFSAWRDYFHERDMTRLMSAIDDRTRVSVGGHQTLCVW